MVTNNAKEAREIQFSQFACRRHFGRFTCPECEEQVKPLVEALETINKHCNGDSVVYSRVALEQWRKAQGEE